MTRFLAALVALVATITLGTTARADAVEGCSSKVVLKAGSWSLDTYYQVPKRWGIDLRDIRLTATTGYWYCPNGRKPDLVKPLWVEFCWSHMSRPHWTFDGVKFNAYYADSVTTSDPPTIEVPDDGTVQNCVRQDVRTEIERWLRPEWNAGWSVTAFIIRIMQPDEDRPFSPAFTFFNPLSDVDLGDWHS